MTAAPSQLPLPALIPTYLLTGSASSAAMPQISPLIPHSDHNSETSSTQLYSTVNNSPYWYYQIPSSDNPYIRPPGVEETSYLLQQPVSVNVAYGQAQQAPNFEPNVAADASAGSCYGNQIPNPYASVVTALNQPFQSKRSGTWIRYPKKTKVVQSAWCEVCKIDCNSKGVLDQHKLGKKHKKNLENSKLATAIIHVTETPSTSLPAPAFAPTRKPIIGPEMNPNKSVNLDTKKRKVLEGGAAADAVRTCIICNVVCNSETVFYYHLAGQKHASMVKKLASMTLVG